MDYNLAAVKVVCSQLKEARQTASPKRMTLGGILFQRVWLQGVLVWASADSQKFILDDGTGLLHLHLSPSPDFLLRPWKIGMYVMVVGGYVIRTDEPPVIKNQIHQQQILDTSNREAVPAWAEPSNCCIYGVCGVAWLKFAEFGSFTLGGGKGQGGCYKLNSVFANVFDLKQTTFGGYLKHYDNESNEINDEKWLLIQCASSSNPTISQNPHCCIWRPSFDEEVH
ncbi:hypothetical protein L484_008999 [Morus notabilis]|uniref:Uncharacterized protein n=1 Tax=Morus notabilis TaxID=981085 RepID=W9QSX2_9ROSA|nr:hypothetical protein L484_008999 [Morus notabilis]